MNAEKIDAQQFENVRAVRVIERHYDRSCEPEVNEMLKLGWKLLLVQTGYDYPVFVLGWSQETEPARTKKQIDSERYSQHARRRTSVEVA